MVSRISTVVLLAVVVLAGCTGSPGTETSETPQSETTATPNATMAQLPSNATAERRALDAERQRIERTIANTTGIDDLAFGPTGGPLEASVTNRTRDGVVVDVVVAIGYRTDCPGGDGGPLYADGHRIQSTYLVTGNETRLQSVEEPLPEGC